MRLTNPNPPQEPYINQLRPRKARPFGKYIYLLIILFAFSGLGTWGLNRFINVQAPATIAGNDVKIESPIKAAIQSLDLKIGDRVEKGAPLLTLYDVDLQEKISQQKGEIARLEAEEQKERKELDALIDQEKAKNNLSLNQAQAKREDLLGKIDVFNLKEKNLEEKIKKLDELFQKSKKLFLLNAITRSQYLEAELKLKDTISELETNASELRASGKKLKFIDEEIAMLNKANSEFAVLIMSKSALPVLFAQKKSAQDKLAHLEDSLKTHTLKSPLSGIVTHIYKKQNEVVLPGEPLLKIIEPESIFIKAYFSQKDESFLHLNDEVKLIYDNGRQYTGRIRKFYPATDSLPSQFKEYYQPDQQAIVAEIITDSDNVPITLGMGLQVQKKRF